ncbi:MAG: sugar-binding protein [Clostridiales bacterium]|nr:sugar-binding protein [Clostridiales bacterium]
MKKIVTLYTCLIISLVFIFSAVTYVKAVEDETEEPSVSVTPTVSEEPTPTVTEAPSVIPSPSAEVTPSAEPSEKPTLTPTPQVTETPTPIATATPKPEENISPTATVSPTGTPYATVIPPQTDKKPQGPKKASDKKVEIRSPKVIKIDGIYENVWDNIETVNIENVSWGKSGASGGFKTYWDKEKIYILVDVKDNTPDCSSEMFSRQDCVEIFINENNEKPEEYGKGDVHVKINREGSVEYGHNANEEIISYGVIKKDGGYMIEASVRFTAIKPTFGTKIGFDVRINDSQGNEDRDYMIQWSDTSMMTFNNLTKIGTITLK